MATTKRKGESKATASNPLLYQHSRFKVKRHNGLWYVVDAKHNNRLPECGRWDSLEKAIDEGFKYFKKHI